MPTASIRKTDARALQDALSRGAVEMTLENRIDVEDGRSAMEDSLSDSRRATVFCVSLVVAIGGLVFAQPGAERTLRDQVYSDAQAAKGKSVYDKQCSTCHDGGMGPSLTGDDFLATWDNKTMRTLYSRILTTMPSDEPGSVAEPDLLDLMAYLIRANGFPAGTKAFESPNDLNAIRIVRSK